MNEELTWIIFSYKVPAEPSTLRVRVWRTLRALGVVYIQQSVCVSPGSPEIQKKIEMLKKSIESNDGEALLLEVKQFSDETQKKIIDMFNQQRTKELEELLTGCQHFLREIETETKKGNFSYHEVEENEADLAKLKRWQKKIIKRDFFSSPLREETQLLLEECERRFIDFMNKVYVTEGKAEGMIKLDDLIK